MKPKLYVSAITIRETKLGWLNKHNGRYYQTAIAAQKAATKDGKLLAAHFGGSAIVITWEPTTPAGTAIIKAISQP